MTMSDLFDDLVREGESIIDRLVTERRQEDVGLDFKLKRDPETPSFGEDDKRVLAKALSAFANSAGGVLIWGVDGRKNKSDLVDCARDAVPIANIEAFKSEANSLLGQLLQPKHDGIEIAAIPSVKQPGAGYLAIRIARSERRPHRSETKDQKQYFKRSGDSSFAMEHYDIEDAFRRVTIPELKLGWELQPFDSSDDRIRCLLLIQLVNDSRLSARHAYLHAAHMVGAQKSTEISLPTGYDQTHLGLWMKCEAQQGTVINPGMRSTVLWLTAEIMFLRRQNAFMVHGGRKEGEFFSMVYRIGCENAQMREGELTLTVASLSSQPLAQ